MADVSDELAQLSALHLEGQLTDEEFAAAKQSVLSGGPGKRERQGSASRRKMLAIVSGILSVVLIVLAVVWVTGRHTAADVAACDAKAADLLSQGTPNADMGTKLEAAGCGWRHEQLLSGSGGDISGAGDMDFEDDSTSAPSNGVDGSYGGVAETPVTEASPQVGTFEDVAGWDDGLQYKVLSVKRFTPSKDYAVGVEKGMKSVEVKVQFTNAGTELMAADFVSVKLLVGSAENEATSFVDGAANDGNGSGLGWTSKEHRAGKGEVATFAFQAPPEDLEDGTCVVVFDRGFVGELRVAGPIAGS